MKTSDLFPVGVGIGVVGVVALLVVAGIRIEVKERDAAEVSKLELHESIFNSGVTFGYFAYAEGKASNIMQIQERAWEMCHESDMLVRSNRIKRLSMLTNPPLRSAP